MNVSRLRLDRISSATRNARLTQEVTIGNELVVREGYVLAVRIMTDKFAYNTVEDVNGRMLKLRKDDVLAGVLGSRRALRGYAGEVPASLQVGELINVLNLGGVLGKCTAINPEIGPPFEAEVLGAVLTFPRIGDRVGVPATIFSGVVTPSETLEPGPPVVFVAGTCMNSGKTVAATEIIRALVKRGYKVAGCKMTGVSLMRDTMGMHDGGACAVVDFNEAGLASTHDVQTAPVARGLLNHLSRENPDLIVAELGDGILGEYGVEAILSAPEIMARACCHVVCAPDPVAIYGAHRIYHEKFGLPINVVSGPVTDNSVGRDYIVEKLGLPAHNARFDLEGLVGVVCDNWQPMRGNG